MKYQNFIEFDELTSTNDYLKKLAIESDISEGTVVLTNFQTSGRGMGKNVWESESGKNLTFSLLLQPVFLPAELMFLISKTISLGIVSYLNTLKDGFSIKWPNDIYFENMKIGGVLIENQLLGNALNNSFVGIGININQETFFSDAPNPISLKNILKTTLDKNTCLKELLKHISIWYKKLEIADYNVINTAYYSTLFRSTNYHKYSSNNSVFTAKIISVENDGQLVLLTTENKTLTFYFKELEFIL